MANAMVMRASRRLLLVAGCALCSSPALAGESIDRLGRLFGFGWSDGYHACGADCYHLGENLPPHSYTADHSLYAVSHQHASIAKRKSGSGCTNCDQNWPGLMPNAADALPMIEEFEEPQSNDRSALDASDIPIDPYTPTEPTPLPPVKKSPPERMPTPTEPQQDRKNAGPKPKPLPDPLDQILPTPLEQDPEESPAPLTEPTSSSDVKEARARTLRAYKRFAEADENQQTPRPKRIGATNPQRLPTVAR